MAWSPNSITAKMVPFQTVPSIKSVVENTSFNPMLLHLVPRIMNTRLHNKGLPRSITKERPLPGPPRREIQNPGVHLVQKFYEIMFFAHSQEHLIYIHLKVLLEFNSST